MTQDSRFLLDNIAGVVADPTDVRAAYNLALSVLQSGDYERAIALLNNVLKLQIDPAMRDLVRANQASAYAQLTKFSEAAVILYPMIEAEKTRSDVRRFAWVTLAYCYHRERCFGLAIMCYERAIALGPATLGEKLALASLYEGCFRYHEAQQALQAALAINPQDNEAIALQHKLANPKFSPAPPSRLLRIFPHWGMAILPAWDQERQQFSPLVIYTVPQLPHQIEQDEPVWLRSVQILGDEPIDNPRHIIAAMMDEKQDMLQFTLSTQSFLLDRQKQPFQIDPIQVLKSWERSLDDRLAALWTAEGEELRSTLGRAFGNEVESLAMEWATRSPASPNAELWRALWLDHLYIYQMPDEDYAQEVDLSRWRWTQKRLDITAWLQQMGLLGAAQALLKAID